MLLSFLFGFLTPLLPAAGSGALLFFSWIFLFARFADRGTQWHWRTDLWAWPVLALLATWVVSECYWGFDSELFSFVFSAAELSPVEKLHVYWAAQPQFLLQAIALARWVTLFCLFDCFARSPACRERFLGGLELGLVLAALATAAQILGLAQSLFPNQSEFWNSLHRFAGTFSDPNAFGIFCGLVVPLLLWRSMQFGGPARYWRLGVAVVIGLLGFYAGSRTYFLALFFYFACAAYRYSIRAMTILAISIALLIAANNVWSLVDAAAWGDVVSLAPQGLRRAIESVTFVTGAEAWFSRVAFWRVDIYIWLDNLLYGIGPEAFRNYFVSYASALGLPTGVWSDNTNSFYLGILAETGFLGALAFAMLVSRLRLQSYSSDVLPKIALAGLLLMLFFGPHLSFDEITVVSAVLLSLTVEVREFNVSRIAIVAAVMLACGIPLRSMSSVRGVYAWENDGGRLFRWTQAQAQVIAPCADAQRVVIGLRSLAPNLSNDPQLVTVSLGIARKTVELRDGQEQKIEFSCGSSATSARNLSAPPVSISVSRLWIPERPGPGRDIRPLGVQVTLTPEAGIQVP